MAKRRWQPPPMNPQPPTGGEPKPAGGVKVDEQVVRNVLKVNPDLRDGRTTFQVKKAIERGESLSPPGPKAPVQQSPMPAATPSVDHGARARQLSETLDFFMTSKGRELSGALDEIAARRRLLDEEEKRLREEMSQKLVEFLQMLDAGVVALHGKDALQAHRELLAKVGLTAAELLERVKRGGR